MQARPQNGSYNDVSASPAQVGPKRPALHSHMVGMHRLLLRVCGFGDGNPHAHSQTCTPMTHCGLADPCPSLLATVSEYDNCFLHILTLRVQLEYRPGTVVAFSRRLLRHGVIEEGGDRCCLAYYMRDNIHNWLGVPRPDPMRFHKVRDELEKIPV